MKLCAACGRALEDGAGWSCPACKNTPADRNGTVFFAPELSEFNSGFDAALFSQLAVIESENFWYRSRNALIRWALHKNFSGVKDFFELGCGTGVVLKDLKRSFSGIRFSASEIYNIAIEHAKKSMPDIQFMQMDARRIPFRDHFDVLGTFDVLEHIEDDETVLAEMFKAVRSGGGIIVTVPQHPFLWSPFDVKDHHVRRYRRPELVDKVKKAGFRDVRTTSFVSFLLPLMILSRVLYHKIDPGYNVMTEFNKKGVTNKILEGVMSVERAFITGGVSFPCGGSLLLTAKK